MALIIFTPVDMLACLALLVFSILAGAFIGVIKYRHELHRNFNDRRIRTNYYSIKEKISYACTGPKLAEVEEDIENMRVKYQDEKNTTQRIDTIVSDLYNELDTQRKLLKAFSTI